ncbi:MAG: copper resistance protein CopC [Candidatus Thermoplasmatota archaeon]
MGTWRTCGALLLFVALVAALPTAAAHAEVASSEPAAGAHLDASPSFVSFSMTQTVDPSATSLSVTNSAGDDVTAGATEVRDAGGRSVVRIALQPDLPGGIYTMVVRTISPDSHPVSYSRSFAIGAFTAPSETGGGSALDLEAGTARFLSYLGLSLVLGAAAFSLFVLPGRAPASKPLLVRLIAAGAAAHLAGTLLQLHYTSGASGLGYGELFHTDVGQNLFLRAAVAAAAVVVALGGAAGKTAAGPTLASLLLAVNLLLIALGSHATKAGPVTVAMDALHIAAAALWAGGLLVFLAIVARGLDRSDVATLRRVGARYGTFAFVSVIVLAATGIILTLALVERDILLAGKLVESPYGMLLAGKVSLWWAMIALAAINRYVLLAEAEDGALSRGLQRVAARLSGNRIKPLAGTTKPFARTLGVEAILGVVVLVFAGFLTSISPPAVATSTNALTFFSEGDSHAVQLVVDPTPQAESTSTLRFTILDSDNAAVVSNSCGRDSCVTLEITAPGNATPERRVAVPREGAWVVENALWPVAGNWTLGLTVSTSTVFRDTVTFTVPIA